MLETTENIGEIVIAPEALEVIIGITASKVEGVYSLHGKRVLDSIGKKNEGYGVYASTDKEGQLSVDIYAHLIVGVCVPDIAQQIQKDVKEAVRNATDVEVDCVNIHVMGIVNEAVEKPAFDDLFKEGFFDVD